MAEGLDKGRKADNTITREILETGTYEGGVSMEKILLFGTHT